MCKKCKKEYKYIQSLHRHSNKCIFEDNENKYDIIEINFDVNNYHKNIKILLERILRSSPPNE
jgi:hypothetical protein